MKLIKCDHCGRPFYDKEKACPYCGHAFNHVSTLTENEELRTENNYDAPASSPFSALRSPFTTPRAESIAAITEANSQLSISNSQLVEDPNQIETTYPPRRHHTLLWVIIILLLLIAIAAAYLFRNQLKQLF